MSNTKDGTTGVEYVPRVTLGIEHIQGTKSYFPTLFYPTIITFGFVCFDLFSIGIGRF